MAMSEQKTTLNLDAPGPWDFAVYALPEHRIALVDDLNRLLGPPSDAMAMLQREFIGEQMQPSETVAFAKVCFGLLKVAVTQCPLVRGLLQDCDD